MKTYRGKITIACGAKHCAQKIKTNVQPGCINCPQAEVTIIDLTGKKLAEIVRPVKKAAPKRRA